MKIISTIILTAILLCAGTRTISEEIRIINPYDGVNWKTFGQYKANLHTHTTQSDGVLNPEAAIDLYKSMGYRILSLTDHQKVTYPWEKYKRNPSQIGMLSIKGTEVTTECHLGNYYSNATAMETVENTLIESGSEGGLVVLCHPNSRNSEPVSWHVDKYRKYNHYIGLEVFNGKRLFQNAESYWDLVLTPLMPARPVWGFAGDDMHKPKYAGYAWTVFILPELTDAALRSAIEKGQFYPCQSSPGLPVPVIRSIKVDNNTKIISIEAENCKEIKWISNGKVVNKGASIDCKRLSSNAKYVRADLRSVTGGRALTNPFGIVRGKNDIPNNIVVQLEKWGKVRKKKVKEINKLQKANWATPYKYAEKINKNNWLILDLRKKMNRAMTGENSWIGRFELNEISPGLHNIHGVPFKVIDQKSNDEKALIALLSKNLPSSFGKATPELVTVPVNKKVAAIYVLHGAAYISTPCEKAGEYCFIYDDGSEENIQITALGKAPKGSGDNIEELSVKAKIQDWWSKYYQFNNKNARKVMIRAPNTIHMIRHLYTLQWINPYPEKTVSEIKLKSAGPTSNPIIFIFSMTAAVIP